MEKSIKFREKIKFSKLFMHECPPPTPYNIKRVETYLNNQTALSAFIVGAKLILLDFWFIAIVAAMIGSVVLHHQYFSPPPDLEYVPIINSLPCATYHGIETSQTNDTASYLGIPYAVPPMVTKKDITKNGSTSGYYLNRWKFSKPIRSIEDCILSHKKSACSFKRGVHTCLMRAYPEFCTHFRLKQYQGKSEVIKNLSNNTDSPEDDESVVEDCLSLSIIRPRDYKTDHYPIVVFITGTGFVSDTTWSAGQDSTLLPHPSLAARLKAVVVRLQYRLGFFGTFVTEPKGPVKNLGLGDIIRGLNYLHEIASDFGGDNRRVTIVGHGSGAAMVKALLNYQKHRGKRLVHAAWISSGPSRIPNNWKFTKSKIYDIINSQTQKNFSDRYEALSHIKFGKLQGFISNKFKDLFTGWAKIAAQMLKRKERDSFITWLAPDNETLFESPTEGDGINKWDDIPVVFANVDSHLEGFEGLAHNTDKWLANLIQNLKDYKKDGLLGNFELAFNEIREYTTIDPQGNLISIKMVSLLAYTCPYHYLAKKLASSQGRKSSVYHFVLQHQLYSGANFLPVYYDVKKHGAFYGLDLLLLLGTAPLVAEKWESTDDFFMKSFQKSFGSFVHNHKLPDNWKPIKANNPWTVYSDDTDGKIKSSMNLKRFALCDTMPFDDDSKKFLRTMV